MGSKRRHKRRSKELPAVLWIFMTAAAAFFLLATIATTVLLFEKGWFRNESTLDN